MSKKINKIVDNYPVLLNSEEKDNLVKTLSSVILEVAPGGTGGKIYTGAEGVYVDNDNNRITLESTAKNAIDNIPHTVGELTDSANYQTVAGMSNYLTTATYQTDSATFLTQTSASKNLAPISVTGDIETLKTASSNWNKVSDKLDTTAFSTVSGKFLTAHQSLEDYANNASANAFNQATARIPTDYITKDVNDLTNYYKKTQTSSDIELAEAFGSILKYDVTAAAGIEVTTTTAAGVKTYGISMTAQPVVTDTRLSGKNVLAVATAATLIGASRQTSEHYGVDTTALGTTWVGVGSNGMHQGFIKYTDGGDVGALDSTNTIQINIKPENAGYNGEMTITNVNGSTTTQSKVVNVPTISYNSMSSFDNTNGPNYMLRKTASGFDIGAAVINVTSLPATTEANTYYFVYDV